MNQKPVWKGFGIACLLWIPISLVIGLLFMYLDLDKTIHPLIWLPISAVIVFIIAIPYLNSIEKKNRND